MADLHDTASEEVRQALAKRVLFALEETNNIITGRSYGYGLGSDDLARAQRAIKDIREVAIRSQFVLANEKVCHAIQARCDGSFQAFMARAVSASTRKPKARR